MVAFTTGSYTSAILPPVGYSEGFVTSSSAPLSMITRYTTLGAVEMRSRSNSRSRRSRTISRCSRPRKPIRNPKPSALEVSGS